MKLASFIATALLAGSAFASQTVTHNWDGALNGISLHNACLTETTVQTIQPVRHCTKLVPVTSGPGGDIGSNTDWVCQSWETSQVAYPRAFVRAECSEYVNHGEIGTDCARWENKSYFLPQTIEVTVVTTHGEVDDFPGVTHNFTFPSCQ